jgi:hypothetical protein
MGLYFRLVVDESLFRHVRDEHADFRHVDDENNEYEHDYQNRPSLWFKFKIRNFSGDFRVLKERFASTISSV